MNEENLLEIEESNTEENEPNTISSAEFIKKDLLQIPETPQFAVKAEDMAENAEATEADETVKSAASVETSNEADADEKASEAEIDPVFAELAAPKLPDLLKENRARLQMQSPNKLYFYWSIKNNPFQTLQKVFAGNTGNYQLVAKFVNLKTEREELYPVDAEGNYWFNAESDTDYRAEIGFYAPNRPFIRVIFSNTIETPRKAPSARIATDADWAVSANTFAQVLDVSGFSRDAFEVALAGDDEQVAEHATQKAFYQFIGENKSNDHNGEEIRFALLALASGVSLDELRGHISESLFLVLEENVERLSSENALAALKDHFEVFDEEIFEEEEFGSAVVGASLLNFPKTIKRRSTAKSLSPKSGDKFIPSLTPLSSFQVGR